MINLAVINIKDILKIIKKIFLIALISVILITIFKKFKFNSEILKEKNRFNSKIIDKNILLSNYYNTNIIKSESGLKKILVSELALFSSEEELMRM